MTEQEAQGPTTQLLKTYGEGGEESAEAFDALFALNMDLLKTLAHAVLYQDGMRDFMHTGSVVNEYCLKVMNAGKYDPKDSKTFQRFAFRGMRQVVMDQARKRAVRPPTEGGEAQLEVAPAHNQRPDTRLEHIEMADKLDAAEPGLGLLLELRAAGFTHVQMAEILGTSETTVKRRWDRGKKILSAANGGNPVEGRRSGDR